MFFGHLERYRDRRERSDRCNRWASDKNREIERINSVP